MTCPNGHESATKDFCDVCGSPMTVERTDASAPASQADAAQVIEAETQADAQTDAAAADLIDLAEPAEASAPESVAPESVAPEPATAPEPSSDQLRQCSNCGAFVTANATSCPICGTALQAPTTTISRPTPQPQSQPMPAPQRSAQPTPVPPQPSSQPRPVAAEPGPAPASSPRPAEAAAWVAEVWIDPEWYRAQQSPDRLPSPGLPQVIPLFDDQIVIGRGSSTFHPQIELMTDGGVSREHALLTFDGRRWWVEDRGSSNGTFIGRVDEPLPTTPVRGRVEISIDDRVYVGSWTRIVVRAALKQEQSR